MRFDPVLRALRGDDAPQRQAQHALIAVRDEWLADPCAAEVLRALGAYGSGAALADCAPLAAAMRTLKGARAFADGLLDRVVPALRAAPLGITPFRHVSHRGVSSLLLARAGRAMLMLSAREPACPVPASIAFADGEQHEIVLAGAAQAHLVTLRAVKNPQGNLMQHLEKKLQEVSEKMSKATLDLVALQEKLMVARIRFQDGLADLSLERQPEPPPAPAPGPGKS